MAPALRQRRFRQGAGLLVLALHLLGVGLSLRPGAWADHTPLLPTQQPLAVRLVRLAPQPEPPPAPPPAPLAAPPRGGPAPAANRPPRVAAPPVPRPPPDDALQAITLPSVPAPYPAPPATAGSATGPDTPPPAPLNLALPRGASAPWRAARNPALDDPRSNLGKLTLEEKLADAMGGDGAWVEETIDADHRRLKRGHTCIDLKRPRVAQLDPFNPAYRALPWMAGTPRRC